MWCTVKLARVKRDTTVITYPVADGFCNFADGGVVATTNIDLADYELGELVVRRFIQIYDLHIGNRHVVYAKKFPPQCAGASNSHAGSVVDLDS